MMNFLKKNKICKNIKNSKFLLMAFMSFFILLNTNIIRASRDTLVITKVGSEILSFIKLWGEMPIAFFLMLTYNKLSNIWSGEKIFRILVGVFLFFFAFCAFFIFPNVDFFHPNRDFSAKLVENFPHFKWFILMWANWSYVLFYIMGELWAIVVYTLMYWQMANKISKLTEAGTFFIFLSLFGQFNLLFSGLIVSYFSNVDNFLSQLFFAFGYSINILPLVSSVFLFSFLGGVILIIHYVIEKRFIKSVLIEKKSEKLVLSTKESLKLIMSSKYLMRIFFIVFGYSASVNLIEGISMTKIREYYGDTDSFLKFQGFLQFYTGILIIFFSVIGNRAIKKIGWISAALVTPVSILITGGGFFICAIFCGFGFFKDFYTFFFAALYNIFSKASKFALCDATKEMAYLPIEDKELKIKGKAAVDIMGAKIGKVVGALFQFFCFFIFPNAKHIDIVWPLFILFVFVCFFWIFSVFKVSKFIKF